MTAFFYALVLPDPKEKPLAENQLTALDALDRLTNEHRNNFEREGKDPDDAKVTEKLWREQLGDIESYTYRNIKAGLVKRGLISLEDGFVHLN